MAVFKKKKKTTLELIRQIFQKHLFYMKSLEKFLLSPRHFVLNDHLVADPPPPPKKKKALFGGVCFFLDKFVNFCPFGIKKILERLGD